MKISFIGCGNMGEAMLAAFFEKGLSVPEDVKIGEASAGRREYLKERYGVAVSGENPSMTAGSDVVVLAIKPQTLSGVMDELKGRLGPEQLVLSIIAGARIDTIKEGLGHDKIVRSMPNTPVRIGLGMSAWTATAGVTDRQKEMARRLLGAMGSEIYFDDESCLDMVTAISGSGPAYFFLMAESLIAAAADIGLPRDAAVELVVQTMIGSAQLLRQAGETPGGLREKVTSPGGTTARAIQVFEEGGFRTLVRRAVEAAYERARELGN